MTEPTRRKKLIEVALPLELINPEATRQKKKAPKGYPTSLHKWWAQRPLATCRAVLFAQLVDDPSSWPDRFPTEGDQKRERERLHKVIEAMVPWHASANEHILNNARWEIARSAAWGLGEEPPAKSNPEAVLAYLQEKAPPVYDPFSGGGSIPLEAQRLGLRAYGSDLNPVAVLISKALIEIPPRFAGLPPVHPGRDPHRAWKGAEGLAEDVRLYGRWMRDEAAKRIGHLYPKIVLPDGSEATVVAWIWARTVASPDPMAKGAHVPLVSSFMLSTNKNRKAWIEVVRDPAAQDGWRFEVKTGKLTAEQEKRLKDGTIGRSGGGTCVLTNAPMPFSYIREKGKKDGLGVRLMAIVAEGVRGRVYLTPTAPHEQAAILSKPYVPELDAELPNNPRNFNTPNFGLTRWSDLFTARQLTAIATFSDLIAEARERALADACKSALLPKDNRPLAEGGAGATAYADAIATYLAFVVDRMAMYGSTQATWLPKDNAIRSAFNRQAVPMTWDFVEANVLTKSSGAIDTCIGVIAACVDATSPGSSGAVRFANAANGIGTTAQLPVISTDPPYYDNVAYSDLSDYFYVWLRRSLRNVWSDLFRRVLTPKDEELVATPYRHNGQDNADAFFLNGMRRALGNLLKVSDQNNPITIYYAFKQSEVADEGLTSPGWATFLQAVFDAGLAVDGTWPVRSEGEVRMNSNSANALASSIVLVCTKRSITADIATRREFIARLKREMPNALQKIKEAGVGPVDMAQSALGPGMGVFTSYAKVLEPDDSEMTVRTAIALINEVREEILGEEDAHYDPATRFCIDWFQAFGTEVGKSGDAIGMANAYNLGLGDLEQAGVFYAKGGVARLLKRAELREDWRPSNDRRLTHWECTQHLIRVLEAQDGGTAVAAALVAEMSPEDAEAARALAYRLYDICEKKGWAQEAQVYNLLAEEFPHLEQAALDHQGARGPAQGAFDLGEVRS
ncbi:MAG: DUF1156 domain-containing protein [Rhodospirillales bacterium]|nr:MAG: DUF1156 domain-containing protein [Rhodospirillales bacterium]